MSQDKLPSQGGAAGTHPDSRTDAQRGPVLKEDDSLTDTQTGSGPDCIPARTVQARSAGARGVFVTERSMADYTKAHFVQNEGQQTPVFVRFSSAHDGQGSPETARFSRGFAVRFYTQEGNCDFVGYHLPVLASRDTNKLPAMRQPLKALPVSNAQDAPRYWDLMTLSPESTHMLTWLFSNDGTPSGYRQMNGYGVHAYKWINAEGKLTYAKYHWLSLQGAAGFTPLEAAEMEARDFSHATRDLYASIELRSFPQWELYVQLLAPDAAAPLPFDPFDPTKSWPEDRFPPVKVGTMTLNQNPVSYFTEVERTAFDSSTLVPGMELSEAEPWQSTAGSGPSASAVMDDFTQAGQRYRSLPEEEREWLVRNLTGELQHVPTQTQLRAVCNFFRADVSLGIRLAGGLGLDLGENIPRN